MDITVTEFQAPKIAINYETLKAELTKSLENYKGLIVTEDTLASSKAAQKELASLRVKIDTYRKDKKKELEKPIKNFEAQCKELISLVESVEQPIKDGISVFDAKKRQEKKETALKLAEEVAAAQGLNEKYAARLDVLEKYMNLTATAKAVREDLEIRAFALKVEQDREQERLDIIQSVIDSENSRVNTKLSMENFNHLLAFNAPTAHIIECVKRHAQQIYDAENAPKEPPKEEEPTNTPPQEEKAVNEAQTPPEKQYTATLKLIGSITELRSVSTFLKANNIRYEVLDQREV